MTPDRLQAALDTARDHLLAQVNPEGFWEGQLSSSALSSATAISAMAVARQTSDRELIARGCRWLSATQNPDGGWGDTTDSPSNLSTTLLCLASLTLARKRDGDDAVNGGAECQEVREAPRRRHPALPCGMNHGDGNDNDGRQRRAELKPRPLRYGIDDDNGDTARALERAEAYVTAQAGETPASRVAAVEAIYGDDRTFAAPILANCALAGLVPWESIAGLPFELAAVPHQLHRLARMQVVSYALPALVAVGVLLHQKNPAANPLTRWVRSRTQHRALAAVAAMQPERGGFLEAAPLTGFVAMSLAAALGLDHPVVARCLKFLRESVRADGSWPIDTNLSVWVTSNAIAALDTSGSVPDEVADNTRAWLLDLQLQEEHPFTHAAPGG